MKAILFHGFWSISSLRGHKVHHVKDRGRAGCEKYLQLKKERYKSTFKYIKNFHKKQSKYPVEKWTKLTNRKITEKEI